MKLKPFSNKIHGNGVIIENKNKFSNKDILNIKKIFENKGLIIFRNCKFNPNNLLNFTDQFTFQYSNDATRREDKFGSKKIKSVDKGFKEIKLHSETSFSTNRPEIIWFYCKIEAEKDGQTTICDGMKLWELFDFNLKNFFLKNSIKYKLKIPIPGMKAQNKKKKKWILSSLGTFDAEYNYRKSQIEFSLLRFAVTESRIPDKLCFANHLMIDLNSEPQIISRTLSNSKRIPTEILKEIKNIAKKITIDFNWKKNDLLMIDNYRFMHGRRPYSNKSKREIVNIQSRYANFGYGNYTRNRI